jgi:hypothetical protein
MPPKFKGEDGRSPTESEAVAYLDSLTGEARELAREYVRKAPPQIDTRYRREFASKLGWTEL